MFLLSYLKPWRGSILIAGLLLAFFSFFLSGCFKKDSNLDDLAKQQEEAYFKQLAADTLVIKKYIADNNITNVKRTNSGLFYVENTVGSGVQAKSGNAVKTDYRLTNLNGDILDTSYGKAPLQFQLGSKGIIFGFQEGVSLMKVGGKSKFFLPSGLAYGTEGSPPKIGPNTVLIFDIELLEAR
jgi:FKBP-type peptidyl-prolyl cis-trans isomerase